MLNTTVEFEIRHKLGFHIGAATIEQSLICCTNLRVLFASKFPYLAMSVLKFIVKGIPTQSRFSKAVDACPICDSGTDNSSHIPMCSIWRVLCNILGTSTFSQLDMLLLNKVSYNFIVLVGIAWNIFHRIRRASKEENKVLNLSDTKAMIRSHLKALHMRGAVTAPIDYPIEYDTYFPKRPRSALLTTPIKNTKLSALLSSHNIATKPSPRT